MIKFSINIFFVVLILFLLANTAFAQEDSLSKIIKVDSTTSVIKATNQVNKNTTSINKHNPKLATKRSLILPGWGQAYNKEYWKIPIVYGALSIPTITLIYNNNIYNEAKTAYEYRYAFAQTNHTAQDSLNVLSLEAKYRNADINAIQTLRNAARRDRDYSIFWIGIVWLLNVADATVFGHLKEFDVSNNLSLNVKPQFNPVTKSPALNFSFKLRDTKKELVPVFGR